MDLSVILLCMAKGFWESVTDCALEPQTHQRRLRHTVYSLMESANYRGSPPIYGGLLRTREALHPCTTTPPPLVVEWWHTELQVCRICRVVKPQRSPGVAEWCAPPAWSNTCTPTVRIIRIPSATETLCIHNVPTKL